MEKTNDGTKNAKKWTDAVQFTYGPVRKLIVRNRFVCVCVCVCVFVLCLLFFFYAAAVLRLKCLRFEPSNPMYLFRRKYTTTDVLIYTVRIRTTLIDQKLALCITVVRKSFHTKSSLLSMLR